VDAFVVTAYSTLCPPGGDADISEALFVTVMLLCELGAAVGATAGTLVSARPPALFTTNLMLKVAKRPLSPLTSTVALCVPPGSPALGLTVKVVLLPAAMFVIGLVVVDSTKASAGVTAGF